MIHEVLVKLCVAVGAAWIMHRGADNLLKSRFYVYRGDFEDGTFYIPVGQAVEVTIKLVDDPNLQYEVEKG